MGTVKYDKKTGAITVKVKPGASGPLYVWVLSYLNVNGEEKISDEYGFVPVNILNAPTSIKIYHKDFPDAKKAYKSDSVEVGYTVDFYIKPTYKCGKELKDTKDGTYTVSVDSKSEDYFSVAVDAGDPLHYIVQAKALKNGKKTSGKITVQCEQNSKKATFTVYAFNSCKKVNVVSGEGLAYNECRSTAKLTTSLTEKVTGTLKIEPIYYSTKDETTDKVKLYVLGSEDGFTFTEKGKLKITTKPSKEQKGISAKLAKDRETITITVKKDMDPGITGYFLIFFNPNGGMSDGGYKVIKVTTEQEVQ